MGPVKTLGAQRAAAAQATDARQRAKFEVAAKEFESLFMNQLMKAMRKTIPKDGYLKESFGQDVYTSMLDSELSKVVSRAGGVGLHQLLIEQMMDSGAKSVKTIQGIADSADVGVESMQGAALGSWKTTERSTR